MTFPSFSFLLLRNASGSSESFREPERSDGRMLRDPLSRRNKLLWLHCLSNLNLVRQVLQINQIKIILFQRLNGSPSRGCELHRGIQRDEMTMSFYLASELQSNNLLTLSCAFVQPTYSLGQESLELSVLYSVLLLALCLHWVKTC